MEGTSIDDLSYGSSDRDIVKDILNMVNTPGGRPPPPQLSTRNPSGMQNLPPPSGATMDPNPNTFVQHTMDTAPAQAHMIGGMQPTPADFANVMHSPGYGGAQPPMQMRAPGGGHYMNAQQSQHAQHAQQSYQMGPQYGTVGSALNTSWSSAIVKEAKIPIFVAILVFVVNLPLVAIMISHSLPSLVSATGGLTTGGMLVKAALAGILFWIIQRVLAPLVTE